MHHRRACLPWVGVIVACVVVAGCKNANEPTPQVAATAGFFQLLNVNSTPVPTVTAPKPPNTCPGFTNSGTLLLTVNPQGYEVQLGTNFDCLNGTGPTFNDKETGTWSLSGGPAAFTLTFTPTGTSALHLSPANVEGAHLTLSFDAQHQDAGAPKVTVNSEWRKQ